MDPEVRIAETVRHYGDGPFRVALLHGGPGAAGELAPVARELAARGISVLELLQTKHSVDGQLEELRRQLESSAHPPAVLAGYSWGAWLGLLFAAQFPALVSKLIMVSSGPMSSSYAAAIMNTRLARLNPGEQAEVQSLLAGFNGGSARNSDLDRLGILMTRADSRDLLPGENSEVHINAAIYASVWAEAARMRESGVLLRRVSDVSCPVTAIHGDCDPHPLEGVRIPLQTRLASFRMHELKNCGHIPWRETLAREVFYDLLQEELAHN